ncbi:MULTISPECIES: hypothetical protein [Bradyrhizobium]|jgi:deferrochelatase/peroxidase EfeB|uniref:Peroxidase n=1 Tax=Bradyrhizobium denitrificans TaxID=2734912 RepID=A0ABS5G032_9BRAD|nr:MULTISPECIES: hypothetical protein [Bradyrhizobium]MBR1134659.1 hypothetical protein [Bradyrhizobium denitrificans]MDU1491848.1 hypothetical protein [Bradyrhizobium sp.]MDU1541873.1 hypothetical protein [Bradyrhizobium sp.]MDU1804994.1 hypothetical protein [Bradyrhizobium sp.]MDU3093616.1 hypothetical protein [Bradyrhizobium sp.]
MDGRRATAATGCDGIWSSSAAPAALVYETDTQPTAKGFNYEHFGFRDGISQPVIRRTERFARGALPRDVMAPGEFMLGYQNNQGFYPPTPVVARELDLEDQLGSVPVAADSRFSAFQDPRPHVRDFGRNGTFLAIRELQQHVEEFDAFATAQAAKVSDPDWGGDAPPAWAADWIKAKMMGRWQDGVPLIDRPIGPVPPPPGGAQPPQDGPPPYPVHGRRTSRMKTDANLEFGVDGPQGLYCPFGAHIRRANPRGSLAPGDDSQLMITNRHRLLRRGRSYQKGNEKGLLFMGLCAEIERQFEFIQQSWIEAPGFAGLTDEPHPIVAVGPPSRATRFTIPTTAGSLVLRGPGGFVTVYGGEYAFLPGRSALMFLSRLNTRSHRERLRATAASAAEAAP